jgi:tRNA A37 threonylcarbamoyladenosine dehydratase
MRFQRTIQLIGEEAFENLKKKKIAVFGLGGVGSYVFEGLVRSGIGSFILVDKDIVDITNIKRELIAYDSTIGMPKVEAAKLRGLDINPDLVIEAKELFYLEETKDEIDFTGVDYIVDAIDNVTAKLLLIEKAKELNIPIICSLGTGNKLDNTQFEITDISKTSMCPLAKVMRKELKNRGIEGVRVIYSKEQPIIKKQTPASIAFVPSVAGLMIAGDIIRFFLKEN